MVFEFKTQNVFVKYYHVGFLTVTERMPLISKFFKKLKRRMKQIDFVIANITCSKHGNSGL